MKLNLNFKEMHTPNRHKCPGEGYGYFLEEHIIFSSNVMLLLSVFFPLLLKLINNSKAKGNSILCRICISDLFLHP